MSNENTMENLVGRTFDFYGVCNNQFKLDNTVYEAVEDPSDGYRSYLDSVVVRDSSGIFFPRPLARVKVMHDAHRALSEYYRVDNVFSLVDCDSGHVWLEFGTENADDYYPYFVFYYKPDPNQHTNLVD